MRWLTSDFTPFCRFFRTFIIIGGCRLVIHMRRQMYRDPAHDTIATAIEFRGLTEQQHGTIDSTTRAKVQILRTAQRIGLPPVSSRMQSFWPDENTQVGSATDVELGDLPSTSYIRRPRYFQRRQIETLDEELLSPRSSGFVKFDVSLDDSGEGVRTPNRDSLPSSSRV